MYFLLCWTKSGERNDAGPLTSAEAAGCTGDAGPSTSRTDDHLPADRRRGVRDDRRRHHHGDGRYRKIGEFVGFFERVGAEIDREAGVIGLFDRRSVHCVIGDAVVGVGKTSPSPIGGSETAEPGAVDSDPVGAREIARLVVSPERAVRLRADHLEKILEAVDRDPIADLLTGRSAVEAVPDIVTEMPMLGVADAGFRSVAVLAERARGGAGRAWTRGDHDRAGDPVARFKTYEEFVQVRVLSLLRTRNHSHKNSPVTGAYGAPCSTAVLTAYWCRGALYFYVWYAQLKK